MKKLRAGSGEAKRGLTRIVTAAVAIGIGCVALPAVADPVADLARRLSTLRGEVEDLSSKLGQQENDFRDQLRAFSRQKADLLLELKKEQTRLQKIKVAMTEKKKVIAVEKERGQELKPVFDEALGQIRTHVSGTLPFRTGERLAELDKIEQQYKAGLLTPERAVSRLWTFLEDELRMTRESGLFRQTITIDGSEQLADVARVGMVMLYFKTSDDVLGFASRSEQGWTFKAVESPEQRKRIADLFDSMKKQIRVGFFELPNALSAGGAK